MATYIAPNLCIAAASLFEQQLPAATGYSPVLRCLEHQHGDVLPLRGRRSQRSDIREQIEIQIIDLIRFGPVEFPRYISAAMLNAHAGRLPTLTETNVRTMWNDLVNRDHYEPTAGVR